MDVSDLSGAELDRMVAEAEGIAGLVEKNGRMCSVQDWDPESPYWADSLKDWVMWVDYSPSQRWDQGGPIIERERIEVSPASPKGWDQQERRWMALAYLPEPHVHAFGPTPLIAAMRAYIASKGRTWI